MVRSEEDLGLRAIGETHEEAVSDVMAREDVAVGAAGWPEDEGSHILEVCFWKQAPTRHAVKNDDLFCACQNMRQFSVK